MGALSPCFKSSDEAGSSSMVAASAHPGCLQTAVFGVLCISSSEEQSSKKHVDVAVALTWSLNSEPVV